MESYPTTIAEYLDIVSRLHLETSDNKKACIKYGISLLLFTVFFIVFFCSIEVGTWYEKLTNTAFVFGFISIGIWFFRRHWSTITQLGFLGMIIYLFRKFFGYFLAILFIGCLSCVIIEPFFTIPAWVTAPETCRIALYIVCIVITIVTFMGVIYRFVIGCIYQRALIAKKNLLNTWYETHCCDLINTESNH